MVSETKFRDHPAFPDDEWQQRQAAIPSLKSSLLALQRIEANSPGSLLLKLTLSAAVELALLDQSSFDSVLLHGCRLRNRCPRTPLCTRHVLCIFTASARLSVCLVLGKCQKQAQPTYLRQEDQGLILSTTHANLPL